MNSSNSKLTRCQFEILVYIESHNNKHLTQREIAENTNISLGNVNNAVKQLIHDNLIEIKQRIVCITSKGINVLKSYKVNSAIIIAAGFSSRLAPITIDTPKPLVKVNGKRIIDSLLDALIAKDVTDITIVVGYKKEQFNDLLDKYPFLKFVENPLYNLSNNISSVYFSKDFINKSYICEADLIIVNPDVIEKYQYCSNHLGAYVSTTDDWCFIKKGNYIDRVSVGGKDCFDMVGISYWNEDDSKVLIKDISDVFNSPGGKENFWDNVPLLLHKKDFHIEIRECKKTDVIEIDNIPELIAIDKSYANYNNNH